MDTHSHSTLALISWVLGVLHFISAHYSVILSVACGLGAFAASLVSIYVGFLKARKLKDEIKAIEHR
jgi:hypothetical protein